MIRSINTKIDSLYEFIPREIVWKWNWNLFHCNRAILINRFYFVDFTLDFTFFFRSHHQIYSFVKSNKSI